MNTNECDLKDEVTVPSNSACPTPTMMMDMGSLAPCRDGEMHQVRDSHGTCEQIRVSLRSCEQVYPRVSQFPLYATKDNEKHLSNTPESLSY